jgi:hypothetical protein
MPSLLHSLLHKPLDKAAHLGLLLSLCIIPLKAELAKRVEDKGDLCQ